MQLGKSVKSRRALRFSTEHKSLRPEAPHQLLESKGPTPSIGADLRKGNKLHTTTRNMCNLEKPKSSSLQTSSWAISDGIKCSKMWRSSLGKETLPKKSLCSVKSGVESSRALTRYHFSLQGTPACKTSSHPNPHSWPTTPSI